MPSRMEVYRQRKGWRKLVDDLLGRGDSSLKALVDKSIGVANTFGKELHF